MKVFERSGEADLEGTKVRTLSRQNVAADGTDTNSLTRKHQINHLMGRKNPKEALKEEMRKNQ